MKALRAPSPAARRYAYRVVSAAVVLAVGYGVISAEMAPAWAVLAAAVFGSGELAAANVPRGGDDA